MKVIVWKSGKGDVYIDASNLPAALLTLFRKMDGMKFYKHIEPSLRPLYVKAVSGNVQAAERILYAYAHIPNREWYFISPERPLAA